MPTQEMGVNELRLIIAGIGALILILIYVFGQPKKPEQGRRFFAKREPGQRIDPVLGEDTISVGDETGFDTEIDKLAAAMSENKESREALGHASVGMRPNLPVEKIVTLFVAARAGETIAGTDLVVAAEKAGLQYGDMGVFHRLIISKPESGPIFSMANMVKPGSFDMKHVDAWQTPGVSFFMALPGPLPALNGWDVMLPCAQRMAELLNATLLDEERNALGRQRIAHIRDDLRAYDRKQEQNIFL